ncbi:MAG TPA: hypothetical protein VML19_12805 [Verrucomicrobiae bacterium]|nr:hypothetical protein [Verrucomicrobiae bacterium]
MKVLRLAVLPGLLAVAVVALPRPATAQGRGERIARVVADCDARVDEFQHMFRRALEHSGYRGTLRQVDLDRHADELSHAMGRVREAWNRERDPGRTRHFVEEAINVSRAINRVMNENRFYPELHRKWSIVRDEINRLAEAFDLPRLRWD